MTIHHGAEQLWRTQEGAHGDEQTGACPAAERWQMVPQTTLSTWGMSTYPLAAPPSRVARMEEADEPLLAVKRGRPRLHQLLNVHSREERTRARALVASHGPYRGANHLAARARDWEVCTASSRSRGGPGKHGRQLGSDSARDPRGGQPPPNLHSQRTIAHPPMPRSHLILYRCAE